MLHAAASRNQLQIVRLLLEKRANPDAPDREERTPLHGAAGRGNHEMAKLLLRFGATLGARDASGWTALHVAASQNEARTVAVLLEAGADPRTRAGETPMQLAWGARSGSVDSLLASYGARK